MTAKLQSLRKTSDFDRVWKQGRSFFLKLIGVKMADNKLGKTRVGLVVSTKISKLAVERNLIKRRMRAILRGWQEGIREGKDIVIIARPGAKNMKFDNLKQEMKDIFSKLGLFEREVTKAEKEKEKN